MFKIKEFDHNYIPEAADLFVKSYAEQRQNFSLIPEKDGLYEFVNSKLSDLSNNPGVVAFDGDRLIGYMIETRTSDDFMGERTAFSLGLYSHSSVEVDKAKIYQNMYAKLAEKWVDKGYYSHIFNFWAQDNVLSYQFFRLGFGMTHFELMRSLSKPKGSCPGISIRKIDSMRSIKKLLDEEMDFYHRSPLFWFIEKDDDFENEVEGDFIAAFIDDEPAGFIHFKINDAETQLLADKKTARIAGAYVTSRFRRRGLGTALLRKAVEWAEEKGLERLYVEGESANIEGGNFWMKHFTPVVYTVRRCVDKRI